MRIVAPVPSLTPEEMVARASKMVPMLRTRQAECKSSGNVPKTQTRNLFAQAFIELSNPAGLVAMSSIFRPSIE